MVDKAPVCNRRCGAVLAFQSKGILISAGDGMFLCNIFGGDSHMARAKGAVQCAKHHVECFDIPHLLAPTLCLHDIGCAAHILCAASQSKICIAKHQGLRHRDDGLQTRSAKAIDVHGRRLVRDASLHGGDPGQIHIARFGVDDMTKGDMADLLGCNLRAGERGFGRDCP